MVLQADTLTEYISFCSTDEIDKLKGLGTWDYNKQLHQTEFHALRVIADHSQIATLLTPTLKRNPLHIFKVCLSFPHGHDVARFTAQCRRVYSFDFIKNTRVGVAVTFLQLPMPAQEFRWVSYRYTQLLLGLDEGSVEIFIELSQISNRSAVMIYRHTTMASRLSRGLSGPPHTRGFFLLSTYRMDAIGTHSLKMRCMAIYSHSDFRSYKNHRRRGNINQHCDRISGQMLLSPTLNLADDRWLIGVCLIVTMQYTI